MIDFSNEQLERYSRHILLQEVGIEGQQKLLDSKVLIIGVGGLGSPEALYLAAAGIGTLGLVDADVVDRSNLQRQIIHFTPDIGLEKVISAQRKIAQINPEVRVNTYTSKVYANNIMSIIQDYDFIIDGTDNFPAKFLINDACVLAGKPFSHGGILRFEGQTLTYIPGNACYRCIFPDLPPANLVPTCAEAGVLGAIAGMLGTIQATEAMKYILGKGELLINQMLIFNAYNMVFRKVAIKKSNRCPICSSNPSITTLMDYKQPICEIN